VDDLDTALAPLSAPAFACRSLRVRARLADGVSPSALGVRRIDPVLAEPPINGPCRDPRTVIETVFFDAAGTLIEVAEPVERPMSRGRAAGFVAEAPALTARSRRVARRRRSLPVAAPGALRHLERELVA